MHPVAFIVVAIAGLLILLVWANAAEEKRRRARLYDKYGKTDLAEKIIGKRVWIGETVEQLRDSLGPPLDVDERVLKTKKKEIWKYVRKGTNRYGLKFIIENGVVVGWDEKL